MATGEQSADSSSIHTAGLVTDEPFLDYFGQENLIYVHFQRKSGMPNSLFRRQGYAVDAIANTASKFTDFFLAAQVCANAIAGPRQQCPSQGTTLSVGIIATYISTTVYHISAHAASKAAINGLVDL